MCRVIINAEFHYYVSRNREREIVREMALDGDKDGESKKGRENS